MIPYSRPKLADLSTLSQSIYRLKTIPFTAAHTHIWQYPPPRVNLRTRENVGKLCALSHTQILLSSPSNTCHAGYY